VTAEPLRLVADHAEIGALRPEPNADFIREAEAKQAAYRSHRKHYRAMHPIRELTDFAEDAE
jgi:hypothetical protein